jgi:hypothetical protein
MLEGGEGINFFKMEQDRHEQDHELVPECETCEGDGYLEDEDPDTGQPIAVACPDCQD